MEGDAIILAIIQARMSSSRLPGKVMLPLGDKPILQWILNAAHSAPLVDGVVVATSTDVSDDIIWQYCYDRKIACYRGSLTDVLERYAGAARMYGATHVVRLTADCPLLNAWVIDQTVFTHLITQADYTRSMHFPDGYDVEVFTVQALDCAVLEAKEKYDREHVTPYFRSGKFRVAGFQCQTDRSGEKYSVDTAKDYKKVCELVGGVHIVH
jgi:spore coat polysaccharide biosynthesis protein SpsF (cytidylyltransferase family)